MIYHHALQSHYTKASRVSILLYNPCKVFLKKAGWKELAIDNRGISGASEQQFRPNWRWNEKPG
jgi:hypothetical protein